MVESIEEALLKLINYPLPVPKKKWYRGKPSGTVSDGGEGSSRWSWRWYVSFVMEKYFSPSTQLLVDMGEEFLKRKG